MANLDTEDKRRSAPNMILFVIHPVADGTIDAQDREQATWIYSGIAPGSPVAMLTRPGKLLLLGVGQ